MVYYLKPSHNQLLIVLHEDFWKFNWFHDIVQQIFKKQWFLRFCNSRIRLINSLLFSHSTRNVCIIFACKRVFSNTLFWFARDDFNARFFLFNSLLYCCTKRESSIIQECILKLRWTTKLSCSLSPCIFLTTKRLFLKASSNDVK